MRLRAPQQVKVPMILRPSFTPWPRVLQRYSRNRSTPLQGVGFRLPSIVHEVLHSPGEPLDNNTRAFVEPRFGYDFSKVRVHRDEKAGKSAQHVGALAYTVGREVVFGRNQYAPDTPSGRYLLAHELAHVVQQRKFSSANRIGIEPNDSGSEKEANQAALYVATTVDGTRPFSSIGESQPALARGEKWADFWGVGPWDSYKAKQLADAALEKTQKTGLPGLHNGPADAWRHCYWNCTMTAEIGADQAETVATNHEKYGGGPANENKMDMSNNQQGRACDGKNCDGCCQSKLDHGDLTVIDSKTGAPIPSSPTPRPTKPTPGSGAYKY